MEENTTRTMAIKTRTLARLRAFKVHPRETDDEVVCRMLDEMQVRRDEAGEVPIEVPDVLVHDTADGTGDSIPGVTDRPAPVDSTPAQPSAQPPAQ